MPKSVAVVGGGVLGCSVAYHLCRLAATRLHVTVLDPLGVGACATAHSAGMLLHLSSSATKVRFVDATMRDVGDIERLIGEPVGVRRCGSLRVAPSAAELTHLRQQARLMSRTLGPRWRGDAAPTGGAARTRWLSPREAEAHVPWLSLAAADAAMRGDGTPERWLLHVADDAVVEPTTLASGYLSV